MTTGIKEAPAPSAKRGTTISLSSDLTALLEEVDRHLRERYGMSPGVELLAHLCIAGKTPGILLSEFEETVLDINTGFTPAKRRGHCR